MVGRFLKFFFRKLLLKAATFNGLEISFKNFNYRQMDFYCIFKALNFFTAWFGKATAIFRMKTALRTDERVRQMNEIIAGIQVIKMYTWEYAFANLIYKSRK